MSAIQQIIENSSSQSSIQQLKIQEITNPKIKTPKLTSALYFLQERNQQPTIEQLFDALRIDNKSQNTEMMIIYAEGKRCAPYIQQNIWFLVETWFTVSQHLVSIIKQYYFFTKDINIAINCFTTWLKLKHQFLKKREIFPNQYVQWIKNELVETNTIFKAYRACYLSQQLISMLQNILVRQEYALNLFLSSAKYHKQNQNQIEKIVPSNASSSNYQRDIQFQKLVDKSYVQTGELIKVFLQQLQKQKRSKIAGVQRNKINLDDVCFYSPYMQTNLKISVCGKDQLKSPYEPFIYEKEPQ